MIGTSGPGSFDNYEFEEMVKKYRVILLNHIRNHIFNDEDANDVYQDTLLAAYRKWDSYIERGKRLNWLFAVSNYCILMWQRKNLPRQEKEVSMEEVEQILKQLPAIETDQGLEEIFTRSVTLDERVALAYFYQKKHTVSEIAQALGISEATIKKRLERGRDHLREDLRHEQNQDKE